jgi:hypothetical protein
MIEEKAPEIYGSGKLAGVASLKYLRKTSSKWDAI